jgi:hypothetical protein
MSRFYIDTPNEAAQTKSGALPAASPGDAKVIRAQTEVRADERARWDADENFWKLDTWSEAELQDNARFDHYMANQHICKRA